MNHQVRIAGIGTIVLAIALAWLSVGTTLNTPAQAQSEDPPLLEAMNTINSGFRSLRRVARRGNFDEESYATAAEMTKAAVLSMHETPPMAETIPTAERKQFIIDYKKETANLIKDLLDLEIAVLEGRTEDVNDMLIKLNDVKNEGHDKFLDE